MLGTPNLGKNETWCFHHSSLISSLWLDDHFNVSFRIFFKKSFFWNSINGFFTKITNLKLWLCLILLFYKMHDLITYKNYWFTSSTIVGNNILWGSKGWISVQHAVEKNNIVFSFGEEPFCIKKNENKRNHLWSLLVAWHSTTQFNKICINFKKTLFCVYWNFHQSLIFVSCM